jgi:hypothetical protein
VAQTLLSVYDHAIPSEEPRMKFAKRVFLIAAIYGFVALLPMYFMEAKIGRDMPPPITHPEYFYGFVGVALAFQFLFLIIASDPVRYRLAMLPGIVEKVAFATAGIALFIEGRAAALVLAGPIIDLILASLFFIAFRLTAPEALENAGSRP